MCDKLDNLVDNKKFSDITFVVQGQRISAHRNILFAKSEFFASMFNSNVSEESALEITIPEIDVSVFRAILRDIYTGRLDVDDNPEPRAMDVLISADRFGLGRLRAYYAERVQQLVAPDIIAKVCRWADSRGMLQLKSF